MMLRNFQDPNYKNWRQQVYKRDHFRCQWPGCNEHKKLNAHHIKTWSEYPSLRYCVSNGITLCKNHHKMIQGMEELYESTFSRLVAKKDGRLQ